MTQYSFNVNGQSLVGNLTWNANGSLAEQDTTDPYYSGDTQNCAYTHDDLSRVASVDCGSVWAQTFGYDAFGNITKSGSQSFAPTYAAATNHMATLPGATPTYDGDGNVTNDGANAYGWDANGNMVTINSTTSTFDALGRLASQSWPGEVMWLPGGLGRIFWQGQVAEVAMLNLPGGARVVYNEKNGTQEYEHSDHLGSGRLVSDTSGNYLYSMAYAPYGETYAQSQFEAGLFTGMGESFNVGLYDSETRELSDAGRWVSPDPAGVLAVDLADPQSWNRYAYVENSPMNFIDPSGMQQCLNGHAGCPPAQSPKYFMDGPFGPITCTLDGVSMPCGTAQQLAGSGAAGQISGSGGPITGNNGLLYQPVLTADGAGYINPNNGEIFYGNGGGELGLPNLDTIMEGLPTGPTGPSGVGGSTLWLQTEVFAGTLGRNFEDEFTPRGCFAQFVDEITGAGGGGDATPPGAGAEDAIRTAGQAGAAAYAMSRGLAYPLRSSIYRGVLGLTEAASEFVTFAPLDYVEGNGLINEVHSLRAGTCK